MVEKSVLFVDTESKIGDAKYRKRVSHIATKGVSERILPFLCNNTGGER